jgi:hypothetical protein
MWYTPNLSWFYMLVFFFLVLCSKGQNDQWKKMEHVPNLIIDNLEMSTKTIIFLWQVKKPKLIFTIYYENNQYLPI